VLVDKAEPVLTATAWAGAVAVAQELTVYAEPE
jgi:hypothetical protein